MATNPWGIDSGYYDVVGRWIDTPPETRKAILASMGVAEEATAAKEEEPVRVVRPGQAVPWSQRGEMCLEDGTQLPISGQLPPDLPLGYHEFRPAHGRGTARVIVVPERCPLPARPMWGWGVQLYAARSPESWGIGDLGDLRRLGRWSAQLGAGVLLVNPLRAAAPVLPQQPSPYFPSSRRFLNPLYLRVEDVPGASRLGPLLERLASAGRALNSQRRIDRDAVFRLKDEALRAIWAGFSTDADFDRFCAEHGIELARFAAYCTLAARFGPDWRQWPAEYRVPDSADVRDFAAQHAREVAYHKWLQWLLDRQLAAAAAPLTLVQDVPIGADGGGADAWVWQDLLARDCTIGAPPDPFNAAGQNWLLPPLIPHKLRAAGYEPFIQTIRASLRHAGGLRIDHVMGLFRLYWIPEGFDAARGAYVRYRADELLGIVALESHRAGAFVVGEDLGTVEPQVREQLVAHRMLSFRVLLFDHQPDRFPELAMATVTTHDLPTIVGLWRSHLPLSPGALVPPPNASVEPLRKSFAEFLALGDDAPPAEMVAESYRRLAAAPSLVLLATLDDALMVAEQPNVPGTITEWPNWSLALPQDLDTLETADLPRRVAHALDRQSK